MILSIFPGLGLLDRAFEEEGFCVVRGPDPIWGGDIRSFHPPMGAFEGVIGGDPCQSHSALANLVRAKGLEPTFPDMTDEFARIVHATQPRWYLRENVPRAPGINSPGYSTHAFLLDNSWLDAGEGIGEEQMRRRCFWFGVQGADVVDLRRFIDFAALELPMAHAATGGGAWVGASAGYRKRTKSKAVTGRHPGDIGATGGHRGSPGRYTLAEMLRLQGLPADFLDHCPLTIQGKRKAIGNGVPQAMGRALARAIKEAMR